jgi:hypothetical protein
MKTYRLIIFKFTYINDLVCFWPLYFETIKASIDEDFEDRALDIIISGLKNYAEINEVSIIHNKLATIEECKETINTILSNEANSADIEIKYLQLEINRELNNDPTLDYDSVFYSKLEFDRYKFPIRVRSKNFKIVLDEIELPLIVIKTR